MLSQKRNECYHSFRFWAFILTVTAMCLCINPDVIAAVNKIADMVSNGDSLDGRILIRRYSDKDGLARKIDVNRCDNMTRKNWIFKLYVTYCCSAIELCSSC